MNIYSSELEEVLRSLTSIAQIEHQKIDRKGQHDFEGIEKI